MPNSGLGCISYGKMCSLKGVCESTTHHLQTLPFSLKTRPTWRPPPLAVRTAPSCSSGGPVAKRPPDDARDTGSIPGPGRPHMQDSQARAPEYRACASKQEGPLRPEARAPRREEGCVRRRSPHGQTRQATVSTKKMPLGVSVATVAQRAAPGPPCPSAAAGWAGRPRPPHALCACLRGAVSSWLLPSAPSESPVCWGAGGRPAPPFTPSSGGLAWSRVTRPRADHATLPTRAARPPEAGSASRACLTPRLDTDQRLTRARQNR